MVQTQDLTVFCLQLDLAWVVCDEKKINRPLLGGDSVQDVNLPSAKPSAKKQNCAIAGRFSFLRREWARGTRERSLDNYQPRRAGALGSCGTSFGTMVWGACVKREGNFLGPTKKEHAFAPHRNERNSTRTNKGRPWLPKPNQKPATGPHL